MKRNKLVFTSENMWLCICLCGPSCLCVSVLYKRAIVVILIFKRDYLIFNIEGIWTFYWKTPNHYVQRSTDPWPLFPTIRYTFSFHFYVLDIILFSF